MCINDLGVKFSSRVSKSKYGLVKKIKATKTKQLRIKEIEYYRYYRKYTRSISTNRTTPKELECNCSEGENFQTENTN